MNLLKSQRKRKYFFLLLVTFVALSIIICCTIPSISTGKRVEEPEVFFVGKMMASGGGAGGPPSRATMSSAFFLGFIALSRARMNAQARRNLQLPPPSRPLTSIASLGGIRHDVYNWNGKDRIIIVGDVHGCADELENLLREVRFERGKDILMFVGDLVRKGPDSSRVVRIARELNAISVRGNHDQIAIDDPSNGLGLHGEDLEYLKNTPITLAIPKLNALLVHAGIIPGTSVTATDPMILMTMRNIVDGQASSSDKQGVPWVDLWKGPMHIIFGHDAKRGLQKSPFATGLDTGCVYGKALTALILPEKKLVSVPSTRPVPATHQAKEPKDPSKL